MTASPALSSGSPVMEASTCYALQAPLELAVEFTPLLAERCLPGLAPEEFLTDGRDDLRVVVYVRRSGSKDPPAAAIRSVSITRVEIAGDRRQDFVLVEDQAHAADPANAGTRAFTLGSVGGHALLATEERIAARTVLGVEARTSHDEGNGRGWIGRTEFPIHPLYPFIRLWVVGGAAKGTSVAGAFACLPQKGRARLAGLPLLLWTESNGTANLTVESGQPVTDAKGLSSWVLRYAGLTWNALAGLRLIVHAGISADPSLQPCEWTRFDILPYDNVIDLLKEIVARRDRLQLTNPGFQSGGDYPWPSVAPTLLRGPAYNTVHSPEQVLAWLGLISEPPESAAPYLCKYIRDRLYRLMESRRFEGAAPGKHDPDADAAMTRMNGIEICAWEMSPVHVWAGIHLSGSEPDDDPRYIDPWWHQEWPADNINPHKLLTKWEQTANAAAVAAMTATLMVAAVHLLVYVSMRLGLAVAKPDRVLLVRLANWLQETWRAGADPRLIAATVGGSGPVGGGYAVAQTHVYDPSYVNGRYISYRDKWLESRADDLSATASTLVVEPHYQRR